MCISQLLIKAKKKKKKEKYEEEEYEEIETPRKKGNY